PGVPEGLRPGDLPTGGPGLDVVAGPHCDGDGAALRRRATAGPDRRCGHPLPDLRCRDLVRRLMTTHVHHHATLDATERARLGRRGQLLAAASVVYNALEAVIAIAAGLAAGSVALVGFGLDSVVEVSSGLIILWQFRHKMPESRERRALRLMALSFFA